jgi:pyruvate kinase
MSVVVEDPDDAEHDPHSVVRRLLLVRGIRPIAAPVSWRASESELNSDKDAGLKHKGEMSVLETKNILQNAIAQAKKLGMVETGDMVVGVHRILGDSIMKMLQVQ